MRRGCGGKYDPGRAAADQSVGTATGVECGVFTWETTCHIPLVSVQYNRDGHGTKAKDCNSDASAAKHLGEHWA